MWWTARVGRDCRRGGPPGGGADCAGCPNPARYDLLSGLPHIQAYRLSGDEQTPQALWKRRPPVAEPWPEAMAMSSVFLFVSRPPSDFPCDHESRVMPSWRSMPTGGGGLRRSDNDVAMVAYRENITSSIAARTWAPASTDIVICKAIAGANIFPQPLRRGPRQRRRALSRPRKAINQILKQPRSNAMLGATSTTRQSADERVHAAGLGHRLPSAARVAATWAGSASAPTIRIPAAAAPASTSPDPLRHLQATADVDDGDELPPPAQQGVRGRSSRLSGSRLPRACAGACRGCRPSRRTLRRDRPAFLLAGRSGGARRAFRPRRPSLSRGAGGRSTIASGARSCAARTRRLPGPTPMLAWTR